MLERHTVTEIVLLSEIRAIKDGLEKNILDVKNSEFPLRGLSLITMSDF